MNPLVSPYIGGAGGVAGLSGASGGTAIIAYAVKNNLKEI